LQQIQTEKEDLILQNKKLLQISKKAESATNNYGKQIELMKKDLKEKEEEIQCFKFQLKNQDNKAKFDELQEFVQHQNQEFKDLKKKHHQYKTKNESLELELKIQLNKQSQLNEGKNFILKNSKQMKIDLESAKNEIFLLKELVKQRNKEIISLEKRVPDRFFVC
jgi:hypothetical protein